MSSLTQFPLFNMLPAELRISVWEISILDHNRDRTVTFHDETKRFMYTRNIACSPHFYVSVESRQVATSLYPIRLPMWWPGFEEVCPERQYPFVREHFEEPDCGSANQWAIYITKHDVFAPCSSRGLLESEYRSAKLAPLHFQGLRRIILLKWLLKWSLKDI
ncbi:hypothetical protein F5Y09DRAFT_317154 [Xylaria sp. FL1042]|nr:hypothetical protein F5Y09DRAFT_317154 [Xylaria sp. FL1042]